MSLPPRPPGDPLVGHTARFASQPFAFVSGALADANERITLNVIGRDPVVVTAHPDDAVAVLNDPAAFGKTADFTEAFSDNIVSAEGDRWKRQRELLEPLFYPSRIREYADVMVRCTRERVAEWTPGEVIDLESEMKALTLEVLFATLFGRELDPETDAALYESATSLNAMFRPTSWALPSWVPTPSRREFDRARATLRAEVKRLLAEHARGDGDPDSLLGRVLAARDDSRLDDAVVRDLMVGMVFAGHETTALSLAFAAHAIGSRPALAERVHAEADAPTWLNNT